MYRTLILFFILFIVRTTLASQPSKDVILSYILEHKDDTLKIDKLIYNADMMLDSDPKFALKLYSYSLELARKCKCEFREQSICYSLGMAYESYRDFSSAVKYYKMFVQKAREMNDSILIANGINQIGVVYLSLNDNAKAKRMFEEALKIYTSKREYRGMAYCNNNLGMLLATTNPQKALEHYNKTLEVNIIFNDQKSESLTYNNIGCLHMYKRNFKAAKNYFDMALDIAKPNNYYRELYYIYGSLGEYNDSINKYNLATKYVKMACKMSRYKNSVKDISWMLSYICELYSKQSKFKEAYKYHIIYKNYTDSLMQMINDKRLILSEFEREKQVSDYQSTIELNEKKRKEKITYIVLTGLTTIALVAIFCYMKRREVKSENNMLNEHILEQKIENNNKELTSKALIIAERNELIKTISEKLKYVLPKLKKANVKLVDEIIRTINNKASENYWREFEASFTKVHPNFHKNILGSYPDLSSSDLKICSFLKLNMSTKEIAALTHMNPKSIEVSRARIRKKLKLSNTRINLQNFLAKY